MPNDPLSTLQTGSVTGRELLQGRFALDVTATAARSDTAAANGEVHIYSGDNGATFVLSIFSQESGTWPPEPLS